MMRHSAISLIGVLSVSAYAGGPFIVPHPAFEIIGHLPPSVVDSRAAGISADGQTVVGENSTTANQAFRWTAVGGMQDLGFLPGPGSHSSQPYAVSGDGQIVVGDVDSHAGRWTALTGWLTLSGGVEAHGISANGLVIVGQASGGGAFRWTGPGGMISIGGMFAYGTSGDGSVVVGYHWPTQGQEACRWTMANGIVGLGDLPGGAFVSVAYAVSADGSAIVGESGVAGGNEAFRWTARDGMIGLGVLPGYAISAASAISADGSVVVGQCHGGAGNTADVFIWDAANGMRSVKGMLSNQSPQLASFLSQWELQAAVGVSADGRVIAGRGVGCGGADVNRSWIVRLDSTELPPSGDLDCSGTINSIDLGILLFNWSIPPTAPACDGATPCAADFNGDGVVNSLDLGILLANWTL